MRIRPSATLVALGLVGALALSGCGTPDDGGDRGPSGDGASNDTATYTIAFQGPLSGNNKQLGINEVNGAELAIDEANAKNDLGFGLKLLKANDVGDSSKAHAAATRVLEDSSVVGVIGPTFSGPTKAVGKTYSDAGMPMISPSASNPTLTDLGFTTFHRVIASDGVEGAQTAAWLAKKTTKVVVVDDLSDYGKGVADVVRAELTKAKLEVVSHGVDAKNTDYGAISAAAKQSGAGAIFYGGYDAQAALFAQALRDAGYTGITIGGSGIKTTVFTEEAGDAGDGWYSTCGCLDAATAPEARDFAAAYKAKFDTAPSTYSAEAYDATNALIEAIKTAAAAGPVTKAAVLAAVDDLDFNGITTPIQFDPDGELVADRPVNLFKQEDGAIRLLGNIAEQN